MAQRAWGHRGHPQRGWGGGKQPNTIWDGHVPALPTWTELGQSHSQATAAMGPENTQENAKNCPQNTWEKQQMPGGQRLRLPQSPQGKGILGGAAMAFPLEKCWDPQAVSESSFPMQRPPAWPTPPPHLRPGGTAGTAGTALPSGSGARLLSGARPFTTPARTGLGHSQRDGLLPQSKGSHELAWQLFLLFISHCSGELGADKEPSSTIPKSCSTGLSDATAAALGTCTDPGLGALQDPHEATVVSQAQKPSPAHVPSSLRLLKLGLTWTLPRRCQGWGRSSWTRGWWLQRAGPASCPCQEQEGSPSLGHKVLPGSCRQEALGKQPGDCFQQWDHPAW